MMKLFISWSGSKSRMIATCLREWLPLVFPSISIWTSSSDIKPGQRWLGELLKTLESTEFGILCVTKESMNSPWVLYEAGAISKSVNTSCLVPYLIDVKTSELPGPLAQFQSVPADKQGSYELVHEIARSGDSNSGDTDVVDAAFEQCWPELENQLSAIKKFEERISTPDICVLRSRELQILEYLAEGKKIKDIANELSISHATVRTHLVNMLSKLNARSIPHAVEIAKAQHLII